MRRRPARYRADPHVADVARSIGDPVRCAMLFALLDGGELPAAELAFRSGASPQAASGHLAKLVDRGLVVVRSAGRRRLFRLASPDVGHAMEALASIAKPAPIVALDQTTALYRLREARSCYDHLAGRLGVSVTDSLVKRGAIRASRGVFALGNRAEGVFAAREIDLERARESRRSLSRACLDWTERRPHLAGSLGAAVLARFLSAGWVRRNAGDRALQITHEGRTEIARCFGVRFERQTFTNT